MKRIFTDFDGPIMDVSERYYQVYQDCLKQVQEIGQELTVLSKADFWRLKRAQIPERQIGQFSGLHDDQARYFARLRRETVHNAPYLIYDQVLPGAIAALEHLQSLGYELVVMTMRRNQTLNQALKHHNLERFFAPQHRYCIPDDHLKAADIVEKPRLMGQALADLPSAQSTWMVGDTEADMAAAHAHDIPIIAVLSGIRDRERLLACNPTWVANNLFEAVQVILDKTPAV
ncbi:MAG: HAD family hydrolase [Cyanobacteria bacterium]|nr:HAD family hydrolase [Cyanobacteriota bacterium]MDA0867317.1 HAD family hydrolase [Cyanobacteriota bacterium]